MKTYFLADDVVNPFLLDGDGNPALIARKGDALTVEVWTAMQDAGLEKVHVMDGKGKTWWAPLIEE